MYALSVPSPSSQPSVRAGICFPSPRKPQSSLKTMRRTDYFLSNTERYFSAFNRNTGRKQHLAFWAKAISLEKVVLLDRGELQIGVGTYVGVLYVDEAIAQI